MRRLREAVWTIQLYEMLEPLKRLPGVVGQGARSRTGACHREGPGNLVLCDMRSESVFSASMPLSDELYELSGTWVTHGFAPVQWTPLAYHSCIGGRFMNSLRYTTDFKDESGDERPGQSAIWRCRERMQLDFLVMI